MIGQRTILKVPVSAPHNTRIVDKPVLLLKNYHFFKILENLMKQATLYNQHIYLNCDSQVAFHAVVSVPNIQDCGELRDCY